MRVGEIAMRRSFVLVLLLAWAASASAEAPSSENWQSTGPFKVRSATDRCVVASAFKRADQKLVVDLEARPGGESYEIRLYAPGSLHDEPWDDGKFSLGSVKLESDVLVARRSNQAGILIYELGAKRNELIAAGPSPELRVRETANPGDLTVVGLDAALALVDACTADLLERWGYSKEFQHTLAKPPKPLKDWASYVSPYDYPAAAASLRLHGDTHALIDVDIDGKASNCRVVRSSGQKEFDKTTCMVVTKRARYEPARNAKGEPIKAPFYLVFRWEVPKL